MAAPSVVTGTVQQVLYVKVGTTVFTTPADYAAAIGASGFKVTASDNLAINTTAFGPISKTGNPVEYTPFGESTTRSIAGAASLSELSFTITVVEANTVHSALLAAAIGGFIEIGVIKGKGTNQVMYYARGEISGSEQTFETPNELTITMALAENSSRFVKA